MMNVCKKLALIVFLATGALSAQAGEFKKDMLMIQHPYIRETPPKAPVAGGFMEIHNQGKTADRLIGVTVDFAKRVEIHNITMKDNIMKMFHLKDGLDIPAGQTVILKPGSLHLMFMRLNKQLTQGETYLVTLAFEKAGKMDVIFNVEKMKHQ